jgi:hypothetical protein
MGNHRSKTANIRGFYLAQNTLLGLNELTYSYSPSPLHIANNSTVLTTYVEHPKAIDRSSCNFMHDRLCKTPSCH